MIGSYTTHLKCVAFQINYWNDLVEISIRCLLFIRDQSWLKQIQSLTSHSISQPFARNKAIAQLLLAKLLATTRFSQKKPC